MELESTDVKELFRTLGSIEKGQEAMGAAIGLMQKDLRKLPCKKHVEELGKRITWRQILAIVSMGFFIIFGAMGLHYNITNSHAVNAEIHGEK